MDWVEISVVSDKEAVEPVSALLAPYGPLAVEELTATPTGGQSFSPVTTIRCYVLRDEAERSRAAIENGLWHLSRLLPIGEPQFREITENDWMNAWKEHYQVVHIGERIVVSPTWRQYQPQPGEVVLAVDPGMAFGTGLHPSTQLILRAMERFVQSGQRVLDVGTGTGILAIAAVKLGAASVLAMDVEEAAVQAAIQNAAVNGVSAQVTVRLGSIMPARTPLGTDLPVITASGFDLILANIIAEVIAAMAPVLLSLGRPGATLVAAGIIEEREHLVTEAFAGRAERVWRAQDGDWVSLGYRLPG